MSLFEDVSTLFAAAITDGQDNEAIVKAAYEDLLGYADADTMNNSAARIDYWVQKLSSGELTTDNFGGSFLEEANTNQGSLISSTTFENNQTVVAAHEDAYEANPDVTLEDLTAVAAENRVEDVAEEDEGVTGETFTLTTNGAVITGTDNSDVTPSAANPGDGDDTFRTTSDNLDGSIINGVGGSDKLEIYRMDSDASPTSVSNVGEVYITGRDGDNETLDADLMTDVTQFWSKDSTGGNVTVDNIQELATIGMTGDTDELTYTANFDSSLTGGTADAVSIALDAVSARADDDNGATIDIDGFETFNVSNSGDTQPGSDAGTTGLNVTGDSVSTLSISGDGTLSLSSDANSIDTVDASGFTGTDIEVDVRSSNEDDLTATVSSAEDATVIVDNSRLAAALTDVSLTLNTGEAADDDGVLGVADVSNDTNIDNLDFSAGTISGVDTVAIANDQANGITLAGDASLDLAGINPSTIVFASGDAVELANNDLTITDGADGSSVAENLTIQFQDTLDSTGGAGDLIVEDSTDVTLDFDNEVGNDNAINLTAASAISLTINGGDDTANLGTLDVADGAAEDTDTLSLSLSGDNLITGTLDITGTNLNGITASNTGEGDRTIGVNGAADLKAEAGDSQAAGSGLALTGAGTGTYTLAAGAGVLDELAVDATEYAGEAVVQMDADPGAVQNIDASNFTAVDTIELSADYTDNNDQAITGIAAGTDVLISADQSNKDLTLGLEAAGALEVVLDGNSDINNGNLLTTEMVDDLTVTSTGNDSVINDLGSTMALPDSTVALETINLAADGGNLTVSDVSLDTSTGEDFTLTLNLTSDDSNAVDVGDVSANGTDNITELVVDSAGTSENIIDDLTVANETTFETLTLTGNADLDLGDSANANNDITLADGVTLDASAMTGDLTAQLVRADTGNEEYTVELGSGDDDLSLTTPGTPGANDGDYTYTFTTDDIGTDSITGFDVANAEDVLDFSALITAQGALDLNNLTDNGVGTIVDGQGNELLTVDGSADNNNDALITAADGQFEGSLQLVGVGNATDLVAADFNFA